MANYRPAPEVADIAQDLIGEHHTHLLNRKIVYIFRDSPQKRAGTEIWGKARKVSGLNAFLNARADGDLDVEHSYDEEADHSYFVIEIAEPIWEHLDETARRALVDHELEHCEVHFSDSGKESLRIIPHNLEEFTAVVRRHGLWKSELRRFAKVTNEQLELDVDVQVSQADEDDVAADIVSDAKEKLEGEEDDESDGERHLQPVAAAGDAETPF